MSKKMDLRLVLVELPDQICCNLAYPELFLLLLGYSKAVIKAKILLSDVRWCLIIMSSSDTSASAKGLIYFILRVSFAALRTESLKTCQAWFKDFLVAERVLLVGGIDTAMLC